MALKGAVPLFLGEVPKYMKYYMCRKLSAYFLEFSGEFIIFAEKVPNYE